MVIMGDILAETAILSNVSKKEPLCSCYDHTSRACLQLNGMAAEKRGLCLSGKSVNMQLFLKDSLGLWIAFVIAMCDLCSSKNELNITALNCFP